MGSSLYGYWIRRLLQAIPLILGVIIVNFTIIQLSPGDPTSTLVGDFPVPPEYLAQVRKDFGLDKPAWQQLLLYIKNVAQGDLGYSFANRQPVLDLVIGRLGATVLLTGTAMILAIIIGLVLGVLSSIRPYSFIDNLSTFSALFGYSVPVFWLGQVLILFFALRLGWFPTGGTHSLREVQEGFAGVLDRLHYLALPVVALIWRFLAVNTRMTRASMLEVLSLDYVRTARAKGLQERAVVIRHALRNAMLPIITVIGFNFGYLLAGSALVETVFSWPGVGRLLFDSIAKRDYPVILGVFIVTSSTVIIANLITDWVVSLLDPRVRY
jgi:peptide/nickel transport system permease protein